MMKFFAPKFSAIFLCLLLIGGCASTGGFTPGSTSAEFGSAVQHNIAVQAVAPTQAQKYNTYIPPDPKRRALARKRYEADKAKEPEPATPSQSTSPR